jgi:tellurite resistance protein TerC
MYLLAWVSFIILILLLVALDLGVLHRKQKVPTSAQAIGWTLFWISLAMVFNVVLYFAYQHHWLGLGLHYAAEPDGYQAALLFFTGYLVEKSLSLDNIFVIALIFQYYQIPVKYQHRVLTWGVLGALILRGIMIAAGAVLIARFQWMNYVFGAFLLFTAVKMLVFRNETFDPESNRLVRWVRRVFPVSSKLDEHHFFTRLNGAWAITPLFLVLLQVEATDVIFAVDSIPAIFAITKDPFIVFTSNIFAILGLRALYFALVAFMNRFRYLKVSLVFILAFVGVKLVLAHTHPIPPYASLMVILGMLLVGILPTLFSKEPPEKVPEGPLTEDIQELAKMSLNQARRLVMIVIGFTILVVGLAMLVLPGPAFIVIPIGLFILAREFAWAKNLLARFKEKGRTFISFFESNSKK